MKRILFWFAVVVFALLFITVFIGGLYPSFEYGNTVRIKAPMNKCFNVLVDSSKMRKWMPGFTSLKLVQGEHQLPGAQYELVITDGERMEMQQTLLAVVPGKEIEYVLVNDVLHSQYSYKVDSTGGDVSTITTHYRVEGKNVFMKAILLLSKSYMQRSDEEMLNLLKNVIESNG